MRIIDLRINNLVKQGKIKSIYYDGRIGLDDGNSYDIEFDNIQPIELTEEWLLKFSFSETEMRPYSDQKAFIIGRDADRIIFSAGRLFKPLPDDGFICICYHCEFAHQLQNAFFAYKNEELEFKFTHENHYL